MFSARTCKGRLSGAVIVLISFELRHLEDQPVAVHLCGHQPDTGANPRIRSNPYTISMDATASPVGRLRVAAPGAARQACLVASINHQDPAPVHATDSGA